MTGRQFQGSPTKKKLAAFAGEFENSLSPASVAGHVLGFQVTLETFVGLVVPICQHGDVVDINWHSISLRLSWSGNHTHTYIYISKVGSV